MLTAHPSGRRAGFTLVELLITMVLVSFVAGAIVKLLLRQQRFYNSTTDLIQTRQQIRQAVAMLPSDLRGISSVGKDIYAMSDSSLEFRGVFGSSVVCTNSSGKLSTVPRVLARRSAMTNWTAIPSVGDSVLVYNDSTMVSASDDAWMPHQISVVSTITSATSTSGCPTTTALTQAGDLTTTNPSYQLTFTAGASSRIQVGSAMRFFRKVHYSVYKASDNKWYLGYYDCKPGRLPVCNAIQPIAGPFRPYAANGTSGVQFAYYDATGVATTNVQQVARISLVVRGQGAGQINLSGDGATAFGDSLRIEVGLRNR
jgi:prepilin-type N-terminal cleavage/methylation domain-containing protein